MESVFGAMEAREALNRAKNNLDAHNREIAAIRQELASALRDEYSAKPSEIDAATLELLKTGVLRSDEYARLLHDARQAGNSTMSRLIAHYAADAAEKAVEKYGRTGQRAMEFRAVAYHSDTGDVDAKLGMFDVLAEAFQRTANNTAMIDHWEELTGAIIEGF